MLLKLLRGHALATVLGAEVVHGAVEHLSAEIETQLAACETELAKPEVTSDMRRIEQVLHRQEQLLARFEALGGSGVEGEARSLMRSLGLEDSDFTLPMSARSRPVRPVFAAMSRACLRSSALPFAVIWLPRIS